MSSDNPFKIAALPWELLKRTTPNGKQIQVIPLTFGRARLVVNSPRWPEQFYEEGW